VIMKSVEATITEHFSQFNFWIVVKPIT